MIIIAQRNCDFVLRAEEDCLMDVLSLQTIITHATQNLCCSSYIHEVYLLVSMLRMEKELDRNGVI